jgi:hypothetical protein
MRLMHLLTKSGNRSHLAVLPTLRSGMEGPYGPLIMDASGNLYGTSAIEMRGSLRL